MPPLLRPRSAASLSLLALLLGASGVAFTVGREATLLDRRAHAHAELVFGAARTLEGRAERLEERARSWSGALEELRDTTWLGEAGEIRAAAAGVDPAHLRNAREALASLGARARDLGRCLIATSPLEPSPSGLLALAPLPEGAGYLLEERVAEGLPSVALARKIHLHGTSAQGSPAATIVPRAEGSRLGRRAGLALEAPPALGLARVAGLASLSLGLFGLLFSRRRIAAPVVRTARVPSAPSPLLALESASHPVLIHRDGRVCWSNLAAARVLRRASPFALLGSRPDEWLDGPQKSRWDEHLDRLGRQGGAATSELEFRIEDGRTFAAEVLSTPLRFDGHASVQTVLQFALRGGPRRRPEGQREIESKLSGRDVMEAIEEGLVVVDATGALFEANSRAEELLGYTSSMLRRLDLASLCPWAGKDELRRLRAALGRASRGASVGGLDVELRKQDGGALRCTLSPGPATVPGRVLLALRIA